MSLIRSSLALALALLIAVRPAAAESPASPAPAAPKPPASRHLLDFDLGGLRLEIPLGLALRAEGVDDYVLDRYGTSFGTGGALSPRARLGLKLDSRETLRGMRLTAEYEHDLPTGSYLLRRPAVTGTALPDSQELAAALRKASVHASVGRALRVGGGLMTSHWGLGLVANDGDHGWTPGSARFTDPRDGDRVFRGYVGFGLSEELGLGATLAADLVWDDDVLLTAAEQAFTGAADDQAQQLVAALTFGAGRPLNGGVYAVYRVQTAADGRRTDAAVLDATASYSAALGESAKFSLAGEAAFVAGTTNLAATPEHPLQGVRQLGLAARAAVELPRVGGVLDVLFASGDQNPDDPTQSGFRADPNYELGLFLFRHVLAAQSGRATGTAGDLQLVGVPAPGLERFPTRGSPSNTITFFPRAWWRPAEGLEIYGGPLFAFAQVPPMDPLNSRVAGGSGRNALDGNPGRFYGTELDLGIRWRLQSGPHQLTLGAEGGVLLPGDALLQPDGKPMPPVAGARAVLDYRL